jgi:chemotaxis protein methyltransferase CheR
MNLFILDEKEFIKFRDIIFEESGIKLSGSKKALVQARLAKRLRALNLPTYSEYYEYLIKNYDKEKDHFLNSITTNKTDFFREDKHFQFLTDEYIPMIEDQKEIRIWSAGCSTGEEPYTLAIVFMEYFFNKSKKPKIKILATDIDTSVIEVGYTGIYNYDKIKDIEMSLIKKYFYRGSGENDGSFKVKPILKSLISFRQLNLLDDTYPMKKKFDIIFCRNVIIYFEKETQRVLFNKFNKYLSDEGRLFIGHSENLSNISDKFILEGKTIYRKNLVK